MTTKQTTTKTTGPVTREVPLKALRRHKTTITRAVYREWVRDGYMQAIKDGASFPPAVAFFDGKDYWLADGHYQLDARQRLGHKAMMVTVHLGTRRDASLYAAGANATHGLLRSTADKRIAVERLLKDKNWRLWSDSEIARRCVVSHTFVAKCKAALLMRQTRQAAQQAIQDDDQPTYKAYTNRHGTISVMDTSKVSANNRARAIARRASKPLYQGIRKFNALLDAHAKKLPAEVRAQWESILQLLSEELGGASA